MLGTAAGLCGTRMGRVHDDKCRLVCTKGMTPMGSPFVPHPEFLITLIGPNSGAGAGLPGAAVRDAVTGRVIDRVTGQMDVYSAVTGTGSNRLFFLAARSS